MPLALHFSEHCWEAIQKDWAAWWAGELERALVVLECVEPQDEATLHYASTFLGNYGLQTPDDELLALFIRRIEATHYLGDAFPRFWPNFGPGIVAAFAGASLHPMPNTTWFSPNTTEPISTLQVKLLSENPWWQQVISITRAAVER